MNVLVTGAASGIGEAVAAHLAAESHQVGVLDITPIEARPSAITGDRGVVHLVADVADEERLAEAIGHFCHEVGGLDAVVVNAAIQLFGEDGPAHTLPLEVWSRTLAVNLTGAFLTIKHSVPWMLRGNGGRIVCMSSPTAISGVGAGFDAYAASKAGLIGLAKAVAADYAADGILVNVVVPGFTTTPLVRSIMKDPDALDTLVSAIPLRRPGSVGEVAAIVGFLVGEPSLYATGSVFVVDGGLTTL